MRQFSILLVGILNCMTYIVICQENNKLKPKDVLQDSWNYITSHLPSPDAQSTVKNQGNGIVPAMGIFADGNANTPLIALQSEPQSAVQSAAQLVPEFIAQPATIQPAAEPASQPVADLPTQFTTDSIAQSSKSASQINALGNAPPMDSGTQNTVSPASVVAPMAPAAPIPPIPPTPPEFPSIQPAPDTGKIMPEANNMPPVAAPVVPVATYSPPLPPSPPSPPSIEPTVSPTFRPSSSSEAFTSTLILSTTSTAISISSTTTSFSATRSAPPAASPNTANLIIQNSNFPLYLVSFFLMYVLFF